MHAILAAVLGAWRLRRADRGQPRPLGSLTSRPDLDFRSKSSPEQELTPCHLPATLPHQPAHARRVHGISAGSLRRIGGSPGPATLGISSLGPASSCFTSPTRVSFLLPASVGARTSTDVSPGPAGAGLLSRPPGAGPVRARGELQSRWHDGSLDVGSGEDPFADALPRHRYHRPQPLCRSGRPRRGSARDPGSAPDQGRRDLRCRYRLPGHRACARPQRLLCSVDRAATPGGTLVLGVPRTRRRSRRFPILVE